MKLLLFFYCLIIISRRIPDVSIIKNTVYEEEETCSVAVNFASSWRELVSLFTVTRYLRHRSQLFEDNGSAITWILIYYARRLKSDYTTGTDRLAGWYYSVSRWLDNSAVVRQLDSSLSLSATTLLRSTQIPGADIGNGPGENRERTDRTCGRRDHLDIGHQRRSRFGGVFRAFPLRVRPIEVSDPQPDTCKFNQHSTFSRILLFFFLFMDIYICIYHYRKYHNDKLSSSQGIVRQIEIYFCTIKLMYVN